MSRIRTPLLAAAAALLLTAVTFAQSLQGGSLAARPDRGATLGGAYSSAGVDSVSLTSGGLSLSIPLASLPPVAGGKLGVTITATYNSKLWDVGRQEVLVAGSTPRRTYVVDTPRLSPRGGWRIGGPGYAVVWRNAHEDFDYVQPEQRADTTDTDWPFVEGNREWHRLYLITPDGAEHELVPSAGGGVYNGTERTYLFGTFSDTPNGRPTRYHTVDGTYLSFTFLPGGGWVVTAPDGTKATLSGEGQRIEDANGNSILIYEGTDGATHYKDEQSDREIRVTSDSSGYRVWYRTVGENTPPQHVDINMGTTRVRGKFYRVNAWNPSVQAEDGSTTGSQCVKGAILDTEANNQLTLAVVTGIVFPATEPGQPGRSFTFGYNSDATESFTTDYSDECGQAPSSYPTTSSKGFGELSRMKTPTGAVFEYAYSLDGTHRIPFNVDAITRDMVTSKKVWHDGNPEPEVWTYDISMLGGGGTVTNPDGTSATESAFISDPAFGYQSGSYNGMGGKVFRSSSSNVVVERRWREHPANALRPAPSGFVADNPTVEAEFTSLVEGGVVVRMSAKTYKYDLNGNLLQTKEYDWFSPTAMPQRDGAGIPQGEPPASALLRQTDTSYYNSTTEPASATLYSRRATSGETLIINAQKETTTGTSITRFRYDGQEFEQPPTKGNVTQVESFDDQGDDIAGNDRWVTTKTTYDPTYGNVTSNTDANGNITHFYYEDATHALPTKVEVDPLNDTNVQTTLTAYDFRTGQVLSTTDANGQTTNIDYTNQLLDAPDPFGRPGVVTGPAVTVDGVSQRREVVTIYEDSLRRVTVESDLRAAGDRLLRSRTKSDQLGRSVLAEQSEDGSTYTVSTQTAYEQGGRVTFTSSPMRAAAAATDGWTRTTKDTAGRVKEVATFAGASRPTAAAECTAGAGCIGKVLTEFYAEFVTVTNSAGKVRRSRADALGRLVRVDEPSDSDNTLGGYDSPTQPTAYTYDTLGNLTQVRQGGQVQLQNGQYQYVGGQTRTFTYGSHSRLSSATSPEACRQEGLCVPAPTTYVYDAAGNLVRRTDPRGVSAHYSYDGLNRVTRRWYNGSGSLTATTHNSPALPAGVGASDEVRYFFDSQPLPPGAPASFDRGYAARRLVATTYGGGSSGTYLAYDAAGRPVLSVQQMGGVNYQVGPVTYNLAGAVTSQRYPSQHTVKYNYDAAGRLGDRVTPGGTLPAFSGTLGDGVQRSYSSEVLYHATGGMSQERFGTQTPLFRKLHYNSRGQLFDIRLSTASWATEEWNWNRGAIRNYYSGNYAWEGDPTTPPEADNNGNLRRQEHLVPADDQVSVYTFTQQTYDYDALNRLSSVAETARASDGVVTDSLRQAFAYDHWGNRTIDAARTWLGQQSAAPSELVNEKQFDPSDLANTNRLYAPGDTAIQDAAQRRMRYDAAGNLIYDNYTGKGARTYDAANRMTAAADNNGGTTFYAYDGDGRRVRRLAGGAGEVWQVYGLGGELLAEYAKDASPTTPRKEYGYRGGELLVTAEANAAAWGPPLSFTGPDPLKKGDPVLLEHLTELRLAVTQLRQRAGLPDYDFTGDPNPGAQVTKVKADHIRQLRAALTEARAHFGLLTAYEHPTLTDNVSLIYAKDFQELRDQVRGAWQSGAGGTDLRWLVSDQLGTPRMVVDRTGSLAGVTRHDYLPFGEELPAGTGGRVSTQGYSSIDNVRQQFTGYEKDVETGLDYAQARYYANVQGRFIGVDPLSASAKQAQPQSWNRYAYCLNNPLAYVDPTGLIWGERTLENGSTEIKWFKDQKELDAAGSEWTVTTNFLRRDPNGGWFALNRFEGTYDHLSDRAVAATLLNGGAAYRMLGFKSPLYQPFERFGNAVDDIMTSETMQRVIRDPGVQGALLAMGVFCMPTGAAVTEGAAAVSVFRIEGSVNTRILIGAAGEVETTGSGMLFLNFGSRARAEAFFAQRVAQGMEGVSLKTFQVNESYFLGLRNSAVLEAEASAFPSRPLLVDTSKAANQFGLRGPQIQLLQDNIIQGSGKVLKSGQQ